MTPTPETLRHTPTPEEQRHETIWLQAWCDGCDKHCHSADGRQWCSDEAWGPCEECDLKPVKYVRADSHERLTARVAELETTLGRTANHLGMFLSILRGASAALLRGYVLHVGVDEYNEAIVALKEARAALSAADGGRNG